jgi:ribosomal protein S27AE
MSEEMLPDDEFVCGRCGATSRWGERFYQANTPNTPFPSGHRFWGWNKTEHYRAFCPRCGALVADRQTDGFGWADGAQPLSPGRLPAMLGAGGDWIPTLAPFESLLVPYGRNILDIEAYKRTYASVVERERSLAKASVPELIRRLRERKGRIATDIELELASRGESAVPHLIEALGDSEAYLRWRVCCVLAGMKGQAATARSALERALRDAEESVRQGAKDALRQIGGSRSSRPWWRFW